LIEGDFMEWFNIIQKNILPAGELERRMKARKEKEIANVPPAPTLPPVEGKKELTPEQRARKKKLEARQDLNQQRQLQREERENQQSSNVSTNKRTPLPDNIKSIKENKPKQKIQLQGATPKQKKNLSGRVKAALQRRGAKKAGFRNVEDYEYYKPKNVERRNLEESIKTQRENLKRKKQQMSSSGGL
tara:strand:+ start:660 stop:1223 length:564 start_codon:yes stop_codon:yes gene_type:complete